MQVAFFQISGDDAEVSAEVGDGMFTGIEAEVGFLVFRIRAVAFVAAVGEDGANVAVKIDRALRRQWEIAECEQDDGEARTGREHWYYEKSLSGISSRARSALRMKSSREILSAEYSQPSRPIRC